MNDNDVLYLESDEEITTAIDKMTALGASNVSIVVPKRSTLLQSIVNLKLLKKAADDASKKLVLVTSDRTATHLAGQLGLAVASSLKAAPTIPRAAAIAAPISEDIVEGDEDLAEAAAASAAATTALTSAKPVAKAKVAKPAFAKPVTVRSLGETATDQPAASKIKVPNFSALQKRLLIGGGVVVAIALLLFANYWLESAHVTLYAKGTAVHADFKFTIDPDIRDSDPAKALLAGQKLETSKDLTGSFTPTGKKDVGTKAHGSMTVTNKTNAERTLVAGTRFQSGDKIFKSDTDVTVPAAHLGPFFNPIAGTASVTVTADLAGDQYNLAPARYTIPALSATDQTFIYGDGNQMSGGTTKQVLVVTAADIDRAKTDLLQKNQDKAHQELDGKAASDYQAITESFNITSGDVNSNPAVGSEATEATLTLRATYTELAVSRADYKSLVEAQEQKLIGDNNQIYDNGISDAKILTGPREPSGRQQFGFNADAYTGAKLNTSAIAKQLTGQRYGDAADAASKLPGVERAEITLSPSWSSQLPGVTAHIKVEIKVAAKD